MLVVLQTAGLPEDAIILIVPVDWFVYVRMTEMYYLYYTYFEKYTYFKLNFFCLVLAFFAGQLVKQLFL